MSYTQDYVNRRKSTYDVEQVLLTAGDQSPGTVTGNEVNIGENVNCEVVLQVRGTIAAGATLDVKVQEADAEGGSYSDVAGGAFAQVTDAGGGTQRIAIITTKPWVSVEAVTATGVVADVECFVAS